jgi:hypothetical protein
LNIATAGILPDLDGSANAIEIEHIQLEHEGIELVP